MTALTGLLWGGGVRMLVVHHVTYSINSLCHFFGRRDFRDRRRVAQPRLAVGLHLRGVVAQQPPRVPDVGAARPALVAGGSSWMVIRAFEAAGLAWDVVRVDERRQARKARPADAV